MNQNEEIFPSDGALEDLFNSYHASPKTLENAPA